MAEQDFPVIQMTTSVEQDLEQGWLNVRTSAGDWASVRDFAREGFAQGTLGFMSETGALGETESHQRATFSDPLPDSSLSTSCRSSTRLSGFTGRTTGGASIAPSSSPRARTS